jgi:hypothetical protein
MNLNQMEGLGEKRPLQQKSKEMSHLPKTYNLVDDSSFVMIQQMETNNLVLDNHPPKTYNLVDNFVTEVNKEQSKTLTSVERHRLLILKLEGFAVTNPASKDFVVELSRGFTELRLDWESVRSPCPHRDRKIAVCQHLNLMDYERLHEGEWFNDRVMQFWKWWLQHGPNYDRDEIDFYDSLQFESLTLGREFDQKRNHLNPFHKKMVLIQLNFSGVHWNLAVLLNLDALKRGEKPESLKSPMPCMLILDSSESNDASQEYENILAWLGRKEPNLDISKGTIPLFYPQVLYQEDGHSCGPLSILNAYCMISLHMEAFTYEYAGMGLDREPLIKGKKPFVDMVESLEFCYSLQHLPRILGDMRCIVAKLSTMQRASLLQNTDAQNKIIELDFC